MRIAREVLKAIRKPHPCGRCGFPIRRARPAVRVYGAAETGDPNYALYFHPECEKSGVTDGGK